MVWFSFKNLVLAKNTGSFSFHWPYAPRSPVHRTKTTKIAVFFRAFYWAKTINLRSMTGIKQILVTSIHVCKVFPKKRNILDCTYFTDLAQSSQNGDNCSLLPILQFFFGQHLCMMLFNLYKLSGGPWGALESKKPLQNPPIIVREKLILSAKICF